LAGIIELRRVPWRRRNGQRDGRSRSPWCAPATGGARCSTTFSAKTSRSSATLRPARASRRRRLPGSRRSTRTM
jgi:hypothetical protein